MAAENQRLGVAERANLVAYLDGELNDAEARAVATKLTQSVSARREVEALERTWELLEFLPRPQATDQLVTRTLSIASLDGTRGERLGAAAGRAMGVALAALALLATAGLTLAAGYAAARWAWPDPSARLARDLPLAEHLDEYRAVGTLDFLKELDDLGELGEIQAADGLAPVATTPAPSAPSPEANISRLRAMPPERRQALLANLRRLDAELAPEERAAVRSLDARLVELDPGAADELRKSMRRYYLWLQTLTPDQRRQVETLAPGDRRPVVERLRDDRRRARAAEGPRDWMQVSTVATLPIQQTAFLLKSWLNLDPQARQEVLAQPDTEKRERKLNDMGHARGMGVIMRVEGPEFDDFLDRHSHSVVDGEARKAGKAGLTPEIRRKRLEEVRKSFKVDEIRRIREAMYLRAEPPAEVDPANLRRFQAEIPEFLYHRVESFAPEAARRRLEVLYRLVYPHGKEIPPPPPKPTPTRPS